MTVLFYVSGHGYGHAVRAGEVIRELAKLRPDWRLLVRTQAPRRMFPDGVEYSSAAIESGVVEREAGVVIDEEATRASLQQLIEVWDDVVQAETRFVLDQSVDLIVADIPPTAGDIAAAAHLPCVAITNFTWDWIFEPYAADLLPRLESSYQRIGTLLRLPFFQPIRMDWFGCVVDIPLIARVTDRTPLRQERKRVLFGSRAQVSDEALARAIEDSPEFEIVLPCPDERFTHQLGECHLVVAKLGFSMLAECIANRKPLLYPPRVGFREEGVLQAGLRDALPSLAIPREDFYAGRWGRYLRQLSALPWTANEMRTDGAAIAAGFLVESEAKWPSSKRRRR